MMWQLEKNTSGTAVKVEESQKPANENKKIMRGEKTSVKLAVGI